MGKFKGEFRKEPWMGEDQIRMLDEIITKESIVLETGSGASTLWMAVRASSVLSFEHREDWYKAVRKELNRRETRNVVLLLDPEYPKKGLSFGKDLLEGFDLTLIDGRGRVRSISTAFKYVRRGGWLVLDNANRPRYEGATKLMATLGWKRKDFLSKVQPEGKRNFTTFWKRPKGI